MVFQPFLRIMASPGPGESVSMSSLKEKLNEGETVYYLTFRFSVAKKGWDLKKLHAQIEELGWKKFPDLENTFVWFGDNPPKAKATEMLKQSAFNNHTCRCLTAILSDVDEFKGTGVSPEQREMSAAASNRSILDYCRPPSLADDTKGPIELIILSDDESD